MPEPELYASPNSEASSSGEVSSGGVSEAAVASSWTLQLLMMALLVMSYFMLWQPVRNDVGTAVFDYALKSGGGYADRVSTTLQRDGSAIRFSLVEGRTVAFSVVVRAPAGVSFLLPGLLLILIAPLRPYWLFLWTGHVLIFGISITLLSASLAWLEITADQTLIPPPLYVADFMQAYMIDIISLAVPIIAIVRNRIATSQAGA